MLDVYVPCVSRKSQEKSAEDKVDKWFARFCSFAHQIHTRYQVPDTRLIVIRDRKVNTYGVIYGVSGRFCHGLTVPHE